MKLLNFLYIHTLNFNTTPILLDVLIATDKFEVVSCMQYYSGLWRIITMQYLELPSSISMAETVQTMSDVLRHYLPRQHRNITKLHEEV